MLLGIVSFFIFLQAGPLIFAGLILMLTYISDRTFFRRGKNKDFDARLTELMVSKKLLPLAAAALLISGTAVVFLSLKWYEFIGFAYGKEAALLTAALYALAFLVKLVRAGKNREDSDKNLEKDEKNGIYF